MHWLRRMRLVIRNKYKILLVEDDTNIRSIVATILESSDYQVLTAGSCAAAQTMFASHLPDLIILDLGLPDADGMLLLDYVRRDSLTPIIVLSARTQEQDKVAALDRGANDYVTKPFGSAELLARVRTALRNNRFSAAEGRLPAGRFSMNGLEIVYDARRVFINGKEIKLTQTEYNIVAFLSENCGKMVTYAVMIKAIWGGCADESSIKRLQVNMANIRRKFGARPGEANYIINELGVGYRMNAERE